MSTKPLSELIAERAYEVYQKRVRSGIPGDQHSDWAQAEKEVTEELKKKDAGKPKAPESKPTPPAKPEAKEPPKPAPKVEPKAEVKAPPPAPPKVEPKPAAPVAASPVKTVVAKKAVKK